MQHLLDLDLKLFRFINNSNSQFLDLIMYWVSNKFFWIPLYFLLLMLAIKLFHKNTLKFVLWVSLLIALSDQGSNFVKHSVQRPRPCREEANLVPKARILNNYHCGKFGFFSAHAANSFAVLIFIGYYFKSKYKWVIPILLGYAFLNCYSRIYLGVHYPTDIIFGSIFGSTLAFIFIQINKKLQQYNLIGLKEYNC